MTDAFDSKYAQMLERTARVLGNRQFAERWMVKPARGLNGQRPIDLLSSADGIELLETFLGRMEHGVYH